MTLVPRSQFGMSFLVAMFCISLMMVGKGCIFGLLLLFTTQLDQSVGYSLGILFGSCALPHLILAIVLAWISIGFKNAVKMFFDYPGVYLTPLFTPFIFGPVKPKEPKESKEPSRWYNSFGNMNMHLSLWFTYANTLLSGIGISIALSYILSLSADFFAQYGNQAVITEFFDKFGFANPSSFLSILSWTVIVNNEI